MASFEETGPRSPVVESIRVDKVNPRVRLIRNIRATVAILLALILLIPVFWMTVTAFKSRADAVAIPPKVFFEPTLQGFVNLFTDRRELTPQENASMQARTDLSWVDQVAIDEGQAVTGTSQYVSRLTNSVI